MRYSLAVVLVALVCAVSVVAVAVSAPSMSSPARVEAFFPLEVRGKVTDSGDLAIPGADVNVSMKRPDTTLRKYYETTTNATGWYAVTFGPSDWEEGDTILTVAEYEWDSASASTVADSCPVKYVNVTMSIAIPEFSGLGALIPVAGVMAMFMVFFFARKKKDA